MASKLKIKVNGLVHSVTASLDTPLLYVLHNELHLHGPRFGCGLAQCGACSVLLDGKEIRSCVTPVAAVAEGDHDARGPAGSVGEGERDDGGFAGVASVAAGVDRRSGAALRLLPERDDDPGRRSAVDDEEPDRGSDPDGDERSSLPLWHLSADPDGDQAGRRCDGEGREVTMTGFLHEKEFSRKTFVKGGGALIIGFSAFASTVGKAQAANANTPFAQRTPADFLPDQTQVDSWITLNADNTVTVTHGETELGHGTPTGILMIVAEEMNMNMNQMKFAHVESWLQAIGGGNGSSGISTRSTAIRAAAALAKTTLLTMASTQLGVPASGLTVADGVVSGGGKTVKYGDLLGGKLFKAQLTSATGLTATPGQPGTIVKPVSQYTVVGKSFPRIDIPAKVNGTYTYIQNVRVPGMVHARIVRPRGSGANTVENAKPLSIDPKSIAHIAGAQVVQVADFLAVVAPKEYDAIQAAAQLKVSWETKQGFPQPSGNFWSWMRTAGDTNTTNPPRFTADSGSAVEAGLAGAAKTVVRRTSTTTTASWRSAPTARSRTSSRTAAVERSMKRPSRSTASRSRSGRFWPACRTRNGSTPRPRTTASSGTRVRARSVAARWHGRRRARRDGRGHLRRDRQAGASAVDALGSARLGPLRRRKHVRRDDGCRCNRQDHGSQLADLRPGAEQHRRDEA